MRLKFNPQTKILSLIIIVILVFSPLFMAQAATSSSTSTTQTQTSTVQLTTTPEYTNYVHNFVGAGGNCTYVAKPMFPVMINDSEIPIGENWTIICPLQAGLNYHIYFYGSYINTSNTGALTDYNVYVYDPLGNLESTHTQSAGLPEHLGTTVNGALFTPTQTGNYTFVIDNNPVDSKGAQEATFMIIQNLQCDQWYSSYIEGTNDTNSGFYTDWAYEFETNASYVQLFINVPSTLDMYEARLYLMNNAASPTLDNFPLAWEPGLYGNLTGSVGGYNFDPNAYRGAAFASCEYWGQSMFLNFTSPNTGPNLYQLVLIGEQGSGEVQLMMKDDFENASLNLSPITVLPDTPTNITYISNETSTVLETAQLSYTTDNWSNVTTINMNFSNQTCSAIIPAQPAGTLVQYQVNATDILENNLEASGNYTVEEASLTPVTPIPNEVYPGNPVETAFSSNGTDLQTAQLSYTTDNWASVNAINMGISNETCNATIPAQIAGTTVQYQVNATDSLENGLFASGNYTVKDPLTISIAESESKIRLGENITISGILTLNYNVNENESAGSLSANDSAANANSNSTISLAEPNYNNSMSTPNYNESVGEVEFSSINSTQTIDCTVSSNGTFTATFRPGTTGLWVISASSPQTQTTYSCYSQPLTVTVTPQPLFAKYGLFIFAGFVAALAVGGIVYALKFRNNW
jgi:hypothetical protein